MVLKEQHTELSSGLASTCTCTHACLHTHILECKPELQCVMILGHREKECLQYDYISSCPALMGLSPSSLRTLLKSNMSWTFLERGNKEEATGNVDLALVSPNSKKKA